MNYSKVRQIADLHIHSTASDGQYTPSELVHIAKKRNLDVIALTDHDTVDGLDEFVKAGNADGLRVLPGIEFGAKEYPSLHILGYNFNLLDEGLVGLASEMKDGRNERKYRIIDFLKGKGVNIFLEEVEELAGGDVISRPHFAQIMVRHGYVKNTQEAFDRYLDTDEYQLIERDRPDARTCIEIIKNAGGKVSVAHPYQIGLNDDELDKLLNELAGYGLDAIECFYPRHTKEQTACYLKLAGKYSLQITGGSDFHGERVKPDVELAAWELDLDWLF